jgi:AcrR family transcriptional regulator
MKARRRPTRGRPRQFDCDQALDRALELFWRHGYEGTSLAALTKAMGISMPSLYAAFGNKEALFAKVVERYIDQPASYLKRALAEPTARSVAEQALRGAIDMVTLPKHRDGCLLVQAALCTGPEAETIRATLAHRRARAEAAVRQRFQRAIDEGDLPADRDAAQLARFLMTVIWGLSVQAAGGAKRSDLLDVAHFAMQAWPD